MRTTKTVWNRK